MTKLILFLLSSLSMSQSQGQEILKEGLYQSRPVIAFYAEDLKKTAKVFNVSESNGDLYFAGYIDYHEHHDQSILAARALEACQAITHRGLVTYKTAFINTEAPRDVWDFGLKAGNNTITATTYYGYPMEVFSSIVCQPEVKFKSAQGRKRRHLPSVAQNEKPALFLERAIRP